MFSYKPEMPPKHQIHFKVVQKCADYIEQPQHMETDFSGLSKPHLFQQGASSHLDIVPADLIGCMLWDRSFSFVNGQKIHIEMHCFCRLKIPRLFYPQSYSMGPPLISHLLSWSCSVGIEAMANYWQR